MFNVHRYSRAVVLSFALWAPLAAATTASTGDDEVAIARQLDRYEQALNASDADGVMRLYAQDAVFMPQHSPPAIGREAVAAAYRRVFDTIDLDVDFSVDEIRVLSHEWAYARTRSEGRVNLVGDDQAGAAEANQELFLLHREADGQWRFARYIFSSTRASQGP